MGRISIKTGFSQNKNGEEAVKEVFEKIRQDNMKLLIFFVDSGYDQQKINNAWKRLIPPETPFLGCSSLKPTVPILKNIYRLESNLSSEGFKIGLTAMSISSDKIEAKIGLMKNIKSGWEKESSRALSETAKGLGLNLQQADPEKYFGILMCDAVSGVETNILENLYAMSGLIFIGGGSSGKLGISNIIRGNLGSPGHIHNAEGVFSDAAIIALIKCDIPFILDMVTDFVPTDRKFKITKAEKGKHNLWYIHELDGKPAAEEYCKAVGVSKKDLGNERIPNLKITTFHPLGLLIKDRAFIRGLGGRKGDSLIMMFPIKEGQELYLMELTDIIKAIDSKNAEFKNALGFISGMILFFCSCQLYKADKTLVGREKLFEKINVAPLVGLNAYGQYYGWFVMEESFVMLAFGE